MKQALRMIEGGWALRIWPNRDYTRYSAVFYGYGEGDLIGHGRTPKKAIKHALREHNRRAKIEGGAQ
jgi:hypothetical protein